MGFVLILFVTIFRLYVLFDSHDLDSILDQYQERS